MLFSMFGFWTVENVQARTKRTRVKCFLQPAITATLEDEDKFTSKKMA